MSTVQEANKVVVQRFNKVFIEQKNDAIYKDLVSEEFKDHSTGGAPGSDGPYLFFTKIFRSAFPDARVVIHTLMAEGDRVLVYKNYEGTHAGEFMGIPATGRSFSFAVMEIIRLKDGKYVEHWAVADTMALMKQLRGE